MKNRIYLLMIASFLFTSCASIKHNIDSNWKAKNEQKRKAAEKKAEKEKPQVAHVLNN